MITGAVIFFVTFYFVFGIAMGKMMDDYEKSFKAITFAYVMTASLIFVIYGIIQLCTMIGLP